MEVKAEHTHIDGAAIYYELAGAGTPLVLIHGFGLDRRMWDDQFAAFAVRYRTVRYDVRGFGLSDLPGSTPYSNHEDLRRLLDVLEIEQAHVCGLSMGGGIAFDFAVEHPERVLSVIGIGSAVGGTTVDYGPMSASVGAMYAAAGEGELAEAKRIWLESPLFAPARRHPVVAARVGQMVEDWSAWQLTNHADHVDPEPPTAQRLGQLPMPVLVINGELDNDGVKGVAVTVEANAPNARRALVPDAGHLANMESPQAVNDLIAGLLTESSSRAPQVVSATREIAATAEAIFELIADPSMQPRWDGNDNLSAAPAGQRVRAVGDVFTMALTRGGVRENHVVEFEEGRLIAWRPAEPGKAPPGHLWRWTLTPHDAGHTLVTHTYDWTQLTDEGRFERARATTAERLGASLDGLAACAEGS